MKIEPAWRRRLHGFDQAQQPDFLHTLGAKRCIVFKALKQPLAFDIGYIRAAGPGMEKGLKIRIHGWASLVMHSRSS